MHQNPIRVHDAFVPPPFSSAQQYASGRPFASGGAIYTGRGRDSGGYAGSGEGRGHGAPIESMSAEEQQYLQQLQRVMSQFMAAPAYPQRPASVKPHPALSQPPRTWWDQTGAASANGAGSAFSGASPRSPMALDDEFDSLESPSYGQTSGFGELRVRLPASSGKQHPGKKKRKTESGTPRYSSMDDDAHMDTSFQWSHTSEWDDDRSPRGMAPLSKKERRPRKDKGIKKGPVGGAPMQVDSVERPSTKTPQEVKGKKRKDPNAPKRPTSAFILWYGTHRDEYVISLPVVL